MADNPYINKVVFGDQTLIDLTDATATAADIAQGATAYGASGELLTGTASGGGRCAYYGTCSTAAATADKAVDCTGYTLEAGNIVAVQFSTGNTTAAPTLNVNSTGAKSIYVGTGLTNGTTNSLKWNTNTVLYFIYDGTYYKCLGGIARGATQQPFGAGAWYGTCITTAGTQEKAIGCTCFRMTAGAVIAVYASTANTYTSGAVKLNVNTTGAKTVVYKGAVTSTTNTFTWDAKTVLLFVYDGTYYRYLGSDRDGGGSSIEPATATPLGDAFAGAVGTSAKYAREDHVHPLAEPFDVSSLFTFDSTMVTAMVDAWLIGYTMHFSIGLQVVDAAALETAWGRIGTYSGTDMSAYPNTFSTVFADISSNMTMTMMAGNDGADIGVFPADSTTWPANGTWLMFSGSIVNM